MSPRAVLTFAVLALVACSTGAGIDGSLRAELLQIQEDDQRYRSGLSALLQRPGAMDSLAESWGVPRSEMGAAIARRQQRADSSNLVKVERILREHGYPGASLVGDSAATAAFYVLQHAPEETLDEYYPLVQHAAEEGELPMRLAAMMMDRKQMYDGEPQRYGTQVRTVTTAEGERFRFVWPIEDPEGVNERRAEAGFRLTVEENARRLGIEYVPYTIAEVDARIGER